MVASAIPRVECQACDQVRQVEISFAEARRSYTKSFERYALELSRSMTIRDVARHLNVGWDLIKDFQKRRTLSPGAMPSLSSSTCGTSPSTRSPSPRGMTTSRWSWTWKAGQLSSSAMARGRRLEAVLETAPAQQGQAHGCGYGHVGGALGRGHDPRAQGEDVFDHFHVIKLFNDKLSDLRRALYREATDVMQKAVLKRGRGGCC